MYSDCSRCGGHGVEIARELEVSHQAISKRVRAHQVNDEA
jgi:hypothetical protein